jgi:hypothetical protein
VPIGTLLTRLAEAGALRRRCCPEAEISEPDRRIKQSETTVAAWRERLETNGVLIEPILNVLRFG